MNIEEFKKLKKECEVELSKMSPEEREDFYKRSKAFSERVEDEIITSNILSEKNRDKKNDK